MADRAATYLALGMIACWTQPVATAMDSSRTAFRTATETGSLSIACYSILITLFVLLLRNDPLDSVWRESERGLHFTRKAGFRNIADMFRGHAC